MSIHTPHTAPPEELIARLVGLARVFGVNDLVAEISPTRGFRIVREGNTAQGVLISRHAMIGVIVCLTSLEVLHRGAAYFEVRVDGPTTFWKEVLS